MKVRVNKYASFVAHSGTLPTPPTDTIILTGSTGSLGIELLASLLENPRVARIYALNRKSSAHLEQRHHIILSERGLDPSIIKSEKVRLLEIDLEAELFGLSSDLYEEVS